MFSMFFVKCVQRVHFFNSNNWLLVTLWYSWLSVHLLSLTFHIVDISWTKVSVVEPKLNVGVMGQEESELLKSFHTDIWDGLHFSNNISWTIRRTEQKLEQICQSELLKYFPSNIQDGGHFEKL